MQYHYPYNANKAAELRSGLNELNRLALKHEVPIGTVFVDSKKQLQDGGGHYTVGLGDAYEPLLKDNRYQGILATISLETKKCDPNQTGPCLIPFQDLKLVEEAIGKKADTIYIPWTEKELAGYLQKFPKSEELNFDEKEFINLKAN